mmetsp:Transcript_3756/g.8050  ORF Transcript_3756/g.8050 Transcript_3756/m.8050 type:complete len:96 (-) Transcript_3756:514-801(-)
MCHRDTTHKGTSCTSLQHSSTPAGAQVPYSGGVIVLMYIISVHSLGCCMTSTCISGCEVLHSYCSCYMQCTGVDVNGVQLMLVPMEQATCMPEVV